MTRLLRRLQGEESGFTLVEMLAAMAVLAILFAIFSLILSNTIRDSSAVEDQSSAQTEVRAAVDVLAGDLRQAYTGDPNTSVVAAISGTTLTFYSPDRATPFHVRKISYQLTGGKLQRQFATSTNTTPNASSPLWTFGSMGPWVTVASNITSASIFTGKYLDSSGNVVTTATPSLVSGVWIAVTISPRGSQGRTYTYSTSASVRAAQ